MTYFHKNLVALTAVFLLTTGPAAAAELDYSFYAPNQAISFNVDTKVSNLAPERKINTKQIELAAEKLAGIQNNRSNSYVDKYDRQDQSFLDRFLLSRSAIDQKF